VKLLRQWKLTGQSLARIRPTEAKASRLQERIAKLEEQLYDAQGVLFEAIAQELRLPAGTSFELDATDPACFIVDEIPNACHGCGEEHEGEQHLNTVH
jgi:hypothetical protein